MWSAWLVSSRLASLPTKRETPASGTLSFSVSGWFSDSFQGVRNMKEGDIVKWRSVNKVCTGPAIGKHPLGWIVKMDNGKIVVVHRKSILNYHEG